MARILVGGRFERVKPGDSENSEYLNFKVEMKKSWSLKTLLGKDLFEGLIWLKPESKYPWRFLGMGTSFTLIGWTLSQNSQVFS